MHIIVELEGVLKGAVKQDPIAEGVLITGALSAFNQITFITEDSFQNAERWLNENKVVDFDNIVDRSVGLDGENLKERQLRHMRSKGKIGLFITSNPELWKYAFDMGIPVILFGLSQYLKTEHRPDVASARKSWSEIEDAVKKQNQIRTQEARQVRTETVRFE